MLALVLRIIEGAGCMRRDSALGVIEIGLMEDQRLAHRHERCPLVLGREHVLEEAGFRRLELRYERACLAHEGRVPIALLAHAFERGIGFRRLGLAAGCECVEFCAVYFSALAQAGEIASPRVDRRAVAGTHR